MINADKLRNVLVNRGFGG